MNRRFKRFVQHWVKKNLTPIGPDADLSVEKWLSKTNYTLKRKQQLLDKWSKFTTLTDPDKKHIYTRVKSFIKEESYDDYKYARAINSRSDEFKCLVGPTFKLIEEHVFQLKWFIKKIPHVKRADYIIDNVFAEGSHYNVTDYSTYEASFDPEVQDACEFVLYDYMTQFLHNHVEFMDVCANVLAGENVCEFKHFIVAFLARRMSGEMCTSLGNGFTNLMCVFFLCIEVNGCTMVFVIVEGDDGILRVVGGKMFTKEQAASLGFILKAEQKNDMCTASFCGLVFDIEDRVIITDPREVLANFGWTSRQYVLAKTNKLKTLLRCKAMSLAYQYCGCPILGDLAQYALRVTKSHDIRGVLQKDRSMSMWEREQLLEALAYGSSPYKQPPIRTRMLVEQLYSISVEVQLRIELQLQNLDDLVVLDLGIDYLVPDSWSHFYSSYCLEVDVRNSERGGAWATSDTGIHVGGADLRFRRI